MISNRVFKRLFASHAFVIADHSAGKLSKSSLQTISAAQKLGGKITIGTFGAAEEVTRQAAALPGIAAVVAVSGPSYFGADNLAASIAAIAKKIQATHVMGSTGSVAKDALPRVGALLDVQPISDVVEVVSGSTFKRPMYAGNVIATVESSDAVKVLTVRPTAFPIDENDFASTGASAEVSSESASESLIKLVAEQQKQGDKVDLASARVVVSGGRGLKSKENFENLLNPLSEKLHAAVGASRAAVDAGYAANDLQIGQTGKIVAPDLYVAVGISGAIQHVAGMKDSRTIVAINKDKDCPIFQVADYGLAGDLFEIVPELTKKL